MDDLILRYAGEHTSPEPEVLRLLNRETHLKTAWPQMLSGHLQGRILAMISKLLKPEAILEIGTFTGYSALCLAEGLPEHGHLHTIEANPEFEDTIRHWIARAGYEEKIHLHVGDAVKLLPGLLARYRFSLAFLDADKQGYPEYYRLLRKGLPSGAFILADNVLWDGKVVPETRHQDPETLGIRIFNQMVSDDPGVEQVILPVRDGLSLIRIL
ncbi:MAG TPA: class I SAM-dependent methyltransferase [Bacteroidales bacterium]|nr:class I SAM-dependent methyltransferase [Bacteroidales bacterium]HRZ49631.1 class I SAM-dependent methyltransferase [Bacteroidales bacterium]